MSFSVLAVRTGEEPETELYPDPGSEKNSVEPEPGDGPRPNIFQASSIEVFSIADGKSQTLGKVEDISANVIITDSRVAVACSKFVKGGGWGGFGIGGMAVAVTANAVSKARAARKRRGKMLVGHIRYEWLAVVQATDRTGMFTKNRLKLVANDPTGENGVLALVFVLDKYQLASVAAEQLLQRAAAFRAGQATDEAHRVALTTYAAKPTYTTTADGKTRDYRLPTPVAQ